MTTIDLERATSVAPTKIKEVLRHLSNKSWNLEKNYKNKLKEIEKSKLTKDEKKQFKNYSKYFKEPLKFQHNQRTYKTGRIFAQYVLFPNKPINNYYLKELIVPEKDYVFVSFDYKASQIRHLAKLQKSKYILNIINNTNNDIYEEIAKDFKEDRNTTKKIVLLLMFGGNEDTIVKDFPNISKEKAIEIRKIHEKIFNLKPYNYNERKQLANLIQKIEANFIKEKLIMLFDIQNLYIRLHAVIHDEIIMEIHKDYLSIVETIKEILVISDIKMEISTKVSTTFQIEKE